MYNCTQQSTRLNDDMGQLSDNKELNLARNHAPPKFSPPVSYKVKIIDPRENWRGYAPPLHGVAPPLTSILFSVKSHQ